MVTRNASKFLMPDGLATPHFSLGREVRHIRYTDLLVANGEYEICAVYSLKNENEVVY